MTMHTFSLTSTICRLPVMDNSTGHVIARSAIPLFSRDTLLFSYLEIRLLRSEKDRMYVPASEVVYFNDVCIGVAPSGVTYASINCPPSPDEYFEILGTELKINSDIFLDLGRISAVTLGVESGKVETVTTTTGTTITVSSAKFAGAPAYTSSLVEHVSDGQSAYTPILVPTESSQNASYVVGGYRLVQQQVPEQIPAATSAMPVQPVNPSSIFSEPESQKNAGVVSENKGVGTGKKSESEKVTDAETEALLSDLLSQFGFGDTSKNANGSKTAGKDAPRESSGQALSDGTGKIDEKSEKTDGGDGRKKIERESDFGIVLSKLSVIEGADGEVSFESAGQNDSLSSAGKEKGRENGKNHQAAVPSGRKSNLVRKKEKRSEQNTGTSAAEKTSANETARQREKEKQQADAARRQARLSQEKKKQEAAKEKELAKINREKAKQAAVKEQQLAKLDREKEKQAVKQAVIEKKKSARAEVQAEKQAALEEKKAAKAAIQAEKQAVIEEKQAAKMIIQAEKKAVLEEKRAVQATIRAEKQAVLAEKQAAKAAIQAERKAENDKKRAEQAAARAKKKVENDKKRNEQAIKHAEKKAESDKKKAEKAAVRAKKKAENDKKKAEQRLEKSRNRAIKKAENKKKREFFAQKRKAERAVKAQKNKEARAAFFRKITGKIKKWIRAFAAVTAKNWLALVSMAIFIIVFAVFCIVGIIE